MPRRATSRLIVHRPQFGRPRLRIAVLVMTWEIVSIQQAVPVRAAVFGRRCQSDLRRQRGTRTFPRPAVAAVIEGRGIGGGWAFAAACDLRLASESAIVGPTPARPRVVSPLTGVRRLVKIVGIAAVRHLLFTGVALRSVLTNWG
ncbi:enoyl-CoA hydratase-related protein [Streptosporangium sp. NPDC002607]